MEEENIFINDSGLEGKFLFLFYNKIDYFEIYNSSLLYFLS